jgi:hypothetical protein
MGVACSMKIHSALISLMASAFIVGHTYAEPKQGWELAFYLGTSFSKNETLTIKQDGYTDITLDDARFATKPFDSPPYYGIRLGRWHNGHGWEVEHIHQKIYIDDLPEEVQHFEITDGYNLFLFNSAWQLTNGGVITRVGIGPVIAHPQITVRGMSNHKSGGGAIPTIWDSDSGYQWAGAGAQLALEKEFSISRHWLLSLEGKITHAQADIDIEGGNVYVPNTAIHLVGGIKYDF